MKPLLVLLETSVLSRSSEYAVRALTYLALRENRGYCLSRTVAEDLRIPAPFLGKVLQALVGRGLLSSHRGRAGGFRLARPAAEIRVAEIVEAFDDIESQRCVLGQAECTDENACPLHSEWCNVRDRFVNRLREMSLADLAREANEAPTSTGSSFPYEQRIANTGMRASFSTE